MTEITDRKHYEESGWLDGRLGQAYDILDELVSELHPESDEYQSAKKIRGLIEALDLELEEMRK